MTDTAFPLQAEKIVTDYLERMSHRLKGMPEGDRRDFLSEIRSHIFESYVNEAGSDETDRILAVLRRLGEPTEVISSWMPQTIGLGGKKKKAPLYILAAILVALFGLPLGIGALAVMVGLLAALFGLLVSYFATAVCLVVAGFAGAVASAIAIVAPGLIFSINHLAAPDTVQSGLFQQNPELAGILGLIVSLIITALGLLMLWSSKHVWRGLRFVTSLIFGHLTRILRRAR